MHLLFNVPVVSRDGEPRLDGIVLLERVVRHRLTGELSNSVSDSALRAAVVASSGTPRELFRLLVTAGTLAAQDLAPRIEGGHMDRACREVRLLLEQTITAEDIQLLARVLRTGRAGESERERDLLYENYIACHANGDAWFRPHELIAGWVREEARGSQ